MNILMLVIKNTAALDFALPLLCRIKEENPLTSVSVLYCTLSRRKILRNSKFYSSTLNESGISEYDFADFLRKPCFFFRALFRRFYSKSNRDSSQWEKRFRFPLSKRLAYYIQQSLNKLENFLTQKVNVQQILPWFSPDIVLFDNTSITQFFGREYFYAYFSSEKKKVVLLPHAPHHSSTTAFTPFDEEGEALPSYCDFWMPFKYDRTWERLPEKKSQFVYIGYPGLDSEWLEKFKQEDSSNSNENSKSLKCLFIIRRFLPKGQSRTPDINAFIYDYEEFSYYLKLVRNAIENTGIDIELIVKPHPSNDFQALKNVFAESGISKWQIAHAPVYALLSECDFVFSLYSTILLIPAMAEIPVVLLNSRIQSVVHQEDKMKQLYTGLHFYLENPEDLSIKLKEVIEIVSEKKLGAEWNKDAMHIRYFYPDGAIQRAFERLYLQENMI